MAKRKTEKTDKEAAAEALEFRTAACCENCVFGGFKVSAFNGRKKQTGLCLRHVLTMPLADPGKRQINPYYRPEFAHYMLYHLYVDILWQPTDAPIVIPSLEDAILKAVEQSRPLIQIWGEYLLQKKRNDEVPHNFRYFFGYGNQLNAVTRSQGLERLDPMFWARDLPGDLQKTDFLKIAESFFAQGRMILHSDANSSGLTLAEYLKKEYQEIVDYHQFWREYFSASTITKIKRTSVCNAHKPLQGRKKPVNFRRLYRD